MLSVVAMVSKQPRAVIPINRTGAGSVGTTNPQTNAFRASALPFEPHCYLPGPNPYYSDYERKWGLNLALLFATYFSSYYLIAQMKLDSVKSFRFKRLSDYLKKNKG